MFLDMTLERNSALVDAAIALHRDGRIEPDTYVIDLDTVRANAAALAAAADRHGVELWFVAKQYGRNPIVSKAIAQHLPLATAIDHREADRLLVAGAHLANVGHLVQIPRRRMPQILAAEPDYVTVFDEANLIAVADAAQQRGREQQVLVRIDGADGVTYPGQLGGVSVDDLRGFLRRADRLPGVRIAGATGFPTIVFDPAIGAPRPTATLDLVLEAARVLEAHGIQPKISLPSHTSVSTIPMIARYGAAFGEPGHALTGTTPQHALDASLAEVPAMVYVSEVAQLGRGQSVFGGGFYGRGNASSVLVDTSHQRRRGALHPVPAENIDYYCGFEWTENGRPARIGDTAIMAFRTQIFVTRSRVAVVSGIRSGIPMIEGIHDAVGREVT